VVRRFDRSFDFSYCLAGAIGAGLRWVFSWETHEGLLGLKDSLSLLHIGGTEGAWVPMAQRVNGGIRDVKGIASTIDHKWKARTEHMGYRAMRDSFTEEQYDTHSTSFWAIPHSWGSAGNGQLAELWREGGAGAVGIVPILGQYAHAESRDDWTLSLEELSRLSGRSVVTVARGATALADLGLATHRLRKMYGKRVTSWSIEPAIAAPRPQGRLEPGYSTFPSRFIYGGQWASLRPAEQAILIAAITQCRSYERIPYDSALLSRITSTDVSDLELCRERTGFVRLACVSYSELQAHAGLSYLSVLKAVRRFKSRMSGEDSDYLYSPLRAYPVVDGAMVYHVRDHVDHWPWSSLNDPVTLAPSSIELIK
jgi:hypothetical protein